ncbi:cytochrome P450 [Limtongia smithiae]|uniref:cytochrome P450 n=1 Tax=Limtongia smithiae TaxID=1125753 RepID=UPI0034CF2055
METSTVLTLGAAGALLLYNRTVASIPPVLLYPLLIVLLLSRRIYKFRIYPFYVSPLRKLPRPAATPHWLYGDFATSVKTPDGTQLLAWAEELSGQDLMVLYGTMNSERVYPISVRAVQEVLQSQCYSFVKPPLFVKLFRSFLGDGLIFAEGDVHKHQRKQLMPAFSYQHINSLVPVFLSESRRLVEFYRRRVYEGGYSDTAEIDVNSTLSAVTLDIIYSAGLGLSFNSLEDPQNELAVAYRKLFTQNKRGSIFLSLLQNHVPYFRYIPLRGNLNLWRSKMIVRKFAYDAIEKKLAKYKARGGMSEKDVKADIDIISVMITEGNEEWTVEAAIEHLTTFFVAGHETTAAAVTIALYYLSLNPSLQTRLRAEIRSAFPNGLDSIRAHEDVESLKFLHNVTREVFRLMPPVMNTTRMASEDVIIAGEHVPKGTFFMISPAIMNRKRELWGPDALEFKPDRWDDPATATLSNMAFLTFLQGPRACIGRRFAELEFKSLLLSLIGSFKFSLRPGQEVKWTSIITYRPIGGLPLQVQSLSDW